MGREQFNSDILGRDESWVGNEGRPLNIRRGSRAEANKIIFNRHNAFLSDSLRTMNYRINPQACLHIMHWLGLAARRAHRLNNLEELTLRWTYLIVHKGEREEICIDLASLLLFVKSFTNLKKMQILLGVGFDNITSTSPKPIDPSASNSELLSPVLPPPLWTSNLTGLGFYRLDSTAVLEKILAHTPALTSFSIAYMDEAGYLTALKHNCPQLTSLHCPVKVYNIKAEDWTDFFRHMPKLEALRFGYSAVELDDRAIFTVADMKFLVQAVPELSWLDVSGAHDVEVVDWINKYHPYLDSVYRSIYW
ncbi:hypothetical protein BGZ74_005455 [Mortierella antarctica]|nr:hypothetical protein BGZ74_005455 [Mortierella antarctica]